MRATVKTALDAGYRAIGATIDPIRNGLTADAVVAAFDPLDAILAIGLNALDAVLAVHLRAFDALRALDPTLHLRTLNALRAFDAPLYPLLNLSALDALRTFGADALARTIALYFSRTFALLFAIALSAGWGRDRQSGNASGEKYPGHDKILLFECR